MMICHKTTGSATVKVRLLSTAGVGNYNVQYFLLAGNNWTSRLSSTSTFNLAVIEKPSSLQGFLYKPVVYKFMPTYVRIGVLIHLNHTVLRSLDGDIRLYLRLVHRFSRVNYEFNSTARNGASLSFLSKNSDFIEVTGRM